LSWLGVFSVGKDGLEEEKRPMVKLNIKNPGFLSVSLCPPNQRYTKDGWAQRDGKDGFYNINFYSISFSSLPTMGSRDPDNLAKGPPSCDGWKTSKENEIQINLNK